MAGSHIYTTNPNVLSVIPIHNRSDTSATERSRLCKIGICNGKNEAHKHKMWIYKVHRIEYDSQNLTWLKENKNFGNYCVTTVE